MFQDMVFKKQYAVFCLQGCYTNVRFLLFLLLFLALCSCAGDKKIKEQRIAKFEQTKKELEQQKKAILYFDSTLVELSNRADSLLSFFKYTKDDKYIDNGFYIHKNLQTNINYLRNFLQVRLTDNYNLILKSYYVGDYPLQANSLIISDGQTYFQCEGKLHAFTEDAYHEILTPDKENAISVLSFLNEHHNDRVYIELRGNKRKCKYYINQQDREALQSSFALYITMQDIHQLEKERDKSFKLKELYNTRMFKDSIKAFSKK